MSFGDDTLDPANYEARCVDCNRGLGEIFYGAGDGRGQRFRCRPCHENVDLRRSCAEVLEASNLELDKRRKAEARIEILERELEQVRAELSYERSHR